MELKRRVWNSNAVPASSELHCSSSGLWWRCTTCRPRGKKAESAARGLAEPKNAFRSSTTGTVKLKGEFPNANLQLWPGQFVNVRLLIDTLRNVIVVPTAAIQRGPDGTFVYVVREDDTVTARRVLMAQQDEVQSVITRGVAADERVVTTGFRGLAEGKLVTVSGEICKGLDCWPT